MKRYWAPAGVLFADVSGYLSQVVKLLRAEDPPRVFQGAVDEGSGSAQRFSDEVYAVVFFPHDDDCRTRPRRNRYPKLCALH